MGLLLIIIAVTRRLHVSKLFVGQVKLKESEAKHARDVLRLSDGVVVDLFDDHGASAQGTLIYLNGRETAVRVEQIMQPLPQSVSKIIVASAIPKGERADWMVEKLSELGVFAFIPLSAQRSVVLPTGKSKHERWKRIATESAKQSKRCGVMRIEELISIEQLLSRQVNGIVLSTSADALALGRVISELKSEDQHLFIGPEGGWTDSELRAFADAGIKPARLTETILRVETAAIAAAAVVATVWQT